MFCQNCGTQLSDTALFCPACGQRVLGRQEQSLSQPIKRGARGTISELSDIMEMGVCPSCGTPVNSFSSICPGCGRELANQFRATACQQLCDKLEQIELSRPKENFFSNVTSFIGNNISLQTGMKMTLRTTDKQKIDLISNFVVPNTKADLLEFISLAEAKIQACREISKITEDVYEAQVQSELKAVWKAKYEQTIEKAKISLKHDPEFELFYERYLVKKYRQKGLCQHCGGQFKGLIRRVCVKCGRDKDY